jgi:hypothetical protein
MVSTPYLLVIWKYKGLKRAYDPFEASITALFDDSTT